MSPWDIFVSLDRESGLDVESCVTQPGCYLLRLAAVDVDLHRVAAIALCLQPCLVADVKAEHQRPTGTQDPKEVPENRGHILVRDVDQ
jgi:hypothetical protein